MNRLIIAAMCLAIVCIHRSMFAQPSVSANSPTKKFDENRTAYLSHTKHLVCGPDGGLIGVALHLKNRSETESIKLHRSADENLPLDVYILDKEKKRVTSRSTAPTPAEKPGSSGMKINWTLGPGESRWFFLSVRSLFDPPPSWERMEGCEVVVSVNGVLPPEDLLAAAKQWKPSGDINETWMNLPGIDVAFRSSVFGNVVLTQASLQADAEKAFAEARRILEDKGSRGAKK